MVFHPYAPHLKEVSRNLRKKMTDAELRLWSYLRRKQVLGIQFHAQKPIGRYVVDFHAPQVNLVVEVDGAQHQDEQEIRADAERDEFLRHQGVMVLRFDDRQVLLETKSVLEEIFRTCSERLKIKCNPP
jgi:very-short-patch-repair endonuclease